MSSPPTPLNSSRNAHQIDPASTPKFCSDISVYCMSLTRHFVSRSLISPNRYSYLTHLMHTASSFEQWSAAASKLDELELNHLWKLTDESDLYDWELIQNRLQQLTLARQRNDLHMLILLLRTSLSRNLGNLGNPLLYDACHTGTKKLIKDYITEVANCLDLICDTEELSNSIRMEFFLNTRQAFGRTALLLSGGATLSLKHVGVVKALCEAKLLPRIISGASGGSIIASVLCTHSEAEYERMLNPAYTKLDFFDDPSENGFFNIINRVFKCGVLFEVETLINTVKTMFGDITFLEAYNRTRKILNITVSSSTVWEMPRLLNYITAPNVYVWSAVAASCSVPYIFKPAPLLAKDRFGRSVHWNPSGHRWIDGSVESDLPMQKLAELFNVNHFIVSQVNPHVVPFLNKSLSTSIFRRICESVLDFSRSELNLRCNQLRELGLLPAFLYRAQSIVSQKYMGDITIIPDTDMSDFYNMLTNPTPKHMLEATIKGERAAWPKISIMENHLQIEMALDDTLYRCRLRALDSQSKWSNVVPNPSTSVGNPPRNGYYIPSSSATVAYSATPTLIPRTFSAGSTHVLTSAGTDMWGGTGIPGQTAIAVASVSHRGLIPHGWGMYTGEKTVSPTGRAGLRAESPALRVKSASQIAQYWPSPIPGAPSALDYRSTPDHSLSSVPTEMETEPPKLGRQHQSCDTNTSTDSLNHAQSKLKREHTNRRLSSSSPLSQLKDCEKKFDPSESESELATGTSDNSPGEVYPGVLEFTPNLALLNPASPTIDDWNGRMIHSVDPMTSSSMTGSSAYITSESVDSDPNVSGISRSKHYDSRTSDECDDDSRGPIMFAPKNSAQLRRGRKS